MTATHLKDKNRIINEMVINTSDVMEAKVKSMEMIAEQFEDKGDTESAAAWRKNIPAIRQAIAIMREYSGCWA